MRFILVLVCLFELVYFSLSFRTRNCCPGGGISKLLHNPSYFHPIQPGWLKTPHNQLEAGRRRNMRCFVSPKPSGITTTRAGKAKILERTQQLIQNSSAILAAPVKGVTMEQIDMLRKLMPQGTVASVVKNSLMRLSVKDTPFAELVKEAKDEIMYFFVPEGFMKKSYDGFQKWLKEFKRTEPEFQMKFIALDNELFKEQKEIEEIVRLPPKKELIGKLLWLLQQIPMRLAQDVRAIPTKLGYAMHEVMSKLEKEAASATSSSAESPVAN